MALIGTTTHTFDIPHEPGNTVTVRRVRRDVLRAANDARQQSSIEKMKNMGGPSFIKELRELRDEKQPETQPETYTAYDERTCLLAGIVSLNGPAYGDLALTPENREQVVDDLDEPTAAFAHKMVVEFATTGAKEKNG